MESTVSSSAVRRRWLREPLLHFLLIGAVLFAVYQVMNPASEDASSSHEIVLSEDDLMQIAVGWRAQGRAEPSAEQMRSLIDARVREEVLYREALAMGMEKDDTIVRRRLAQKMEFLLEDASRIEDPAPDVLRTWYTAHADQFAREPRVTLRHLYFSPDVRGAQAQADAARALQRLEGAGADVSTDSLGDPFMYQDRYPDRSVDQLAGVFGPAFAEAVVTLPAKRWVGPVQSGYGWHLVYLEDVVPGRVPAFDEVEPEAREAWIEEQRATGRQQAFDLMRARYRVILPASEVAANAAKVEPGVSK